MRQTKKQLFWEIVRFLLVGGAATLVDYAVFWIFDGLLFPLLPKQSETAQTVYLVLATALGFGVGLSVNWILSVRVVFLTVKDGEKARSKKSFAVFAAIGLIGLLLTEIGVVLLVAVLPEITLFGVTELLNTAWKKWLAKGIMTLLVLAWNYAGRKLLIFRT